MGIWPHTCIYPVESTARVMKAFYFIAMLIGLSACEFYYQDPLYSSRDRIIGRYDMEEYSETFNDFTRYTLWIERSSRGADAIWIDNFYASNIRVRAYISYDRITIPRQTVNGYDVEGVGSIFGNRISFSYRVRDLYSSSRTDFLDGTAIKYY